MVSKLGYIKPFPKGTHMWVDFKKSISRSSISNEHTIITFFYLFKKRIRLFTHLKFYFVLP